jgi:catechol 2,3-dioxygenase-like lactoylglutathione lyase family enzyme
MNLLTDATADTTSGPGVHVQRVLHWAIPVHDLEESKRFYSQILGMRYRDNLGPDIACMAFGDGPPTNVLLCRRPGSDSISRQEVGSTHYAFVVSPQDFDRAIEQLRAWTGGRVVKPETPDRPGHWQEGDVEYRRVKLFQGRSLYMLDPTGNTVEICDLLPGNG